MTDTYEMPRRKRGDCWTPAERAIDDAVDVVERAGCDVRLTDAVILLQLARERVADFVDNTPARELLGLPAREPTPREKGSSQ